MTYHIGGGTSEADRAGFFTSPGQGHAVVLESGWLDRVRQTTQYLYEFDP